MRSVVEGAGSALPMTILLAVSGWDIGPWRRRLEALLPSHKVATLDEPFDRASIRYALSWRHPPGALSNLPNLEAIFSLGAGVDHLFADPALPDSPIVRVVDPDLTDADERVGGHARARAPAPVAPLRAPAARAPVGGRRRSAEGGRDPGRRARPRRPRRRRRVEARRARLQGRRLERERKVAAAASPASMGPRASTACSR